MKRLTCVVCVLLVLLSLVSLVPLAAFASSTEPSGATEPTGTTPPAPPKVPSCPITITFKVGSTKLYTKTIDISDKSVSITGEKFITHKKKMYKYSVITVSGKKTHLVKVPPVPEGAAELKEWKKAWEKTINIIYTPHTHKYKPGYNRIYHWSICECGKTTNEIRHVDPATDADKVCTCGYVFNNNAQLSTLWLANMNLSPRFDKEVDTYIGEVVTWKDVTDTSITARTYDALSKVQLPEDLSIHEGANKFEILVTAEDKATTKVYTVIAVKPVQVERASIGSDGTTVSSKEKPNKTANQTASLTPTQAVTDKLLELAAADKCTAIAFAPDYSKWGAQRFELILTGDFLLAMAEQTGASLQIRTPYGSTLTIPQEDLAELAGDREQIVIQVGKDGTFAVLAGGEAVALSENVKLEVPETK